MGRNRHLNEMPSLGSSVLWSGLNLQVGIIESIDMSTYTCTVILSDGAGERRSVALPTTYVMGPCWVRNIPPEGVGVLLSFRGQNKIEILKFFDEESSVARLNSKEYAKGTSLFRDIVPGENDSMTPGHAGNWETVRGRKYIHAGPVSIELNRDTMTARFDASTFDISSPHGLDYNHIRYGTVRRYIDGYNTIITMDSVPISQGGIDLREFGVSVALDPITDQTKDIPKMGPKLADVRVGNVVDENGEEEMSPKSTRPLRFRLRVHNEENSFFADAHIDNAGNMVLSLPPTAAFGCLVEILGGNFEIFVPKGEHTIVADSVSITAKEGVAIQSDANTVLTSKNVTSIGAKEQVQLSAGDLIALVCKRLGMSADTQAFLSALDSFTVKGGKKASLKSDAQAVVSAPDTRIGAEDASLRVVLETFLEYFLTHTHAGVTSGTAVSGPVVGTVPDNVLSVNTKVK